MPFKGAFISAGDGRYSMMVSPETLKMALLAVGQTVEVRFRVADQEAVDVPDALADALAEDDNAAQAWDVLTAGRRRALSRFVSSAKTGPTRNRRVAAMLTAISGRIPEAAIADEVKRLGRLLGQGRG